MVGGLGFRSSVRIRPFGDDLANSEQRAINDFAREDKIRTGNRVASGRQMAFIGVRPGI